MPAELTAPAGPNRRRAGRWPSAGRWALGRSGGRPAAAPAGLGLGRGALVTALVSSVVLLGAAACDSSGPDTTTSGTGGMDRTGPRGASSTSTASASRGPGTGSTATAGPGDDQAADHVVASGLAAPWGLAFLPSGDALVGERDSGRVLRVPAGGGTPVPVTTLPGVHHEGESGLLGLAVSPSYATDGLVYAYYTTATDNRIARFTLPAAGGGAPSGLRPILTGLAAFWIHDGGRIAFGPDGMLYAGVGDASVPGRAQDPTSRNGKILRMRPDGSVPPDNPFPGSLVYSLGHRNVQGLAWDSTGRLWATEFGQNRFDEVNEIRPGANYGWPVVEGVGDTHGGRYTNPVVTWPTIESSPSGAAIVGGTLYVAALRGTRLWTVSLPPGPPAAGTSTTGGTSSDGDGDGGVGVGVGVGPPRASRTGAYGRLRTLAAAPDGTLWVTTSNTDGRGTPGRDDDRIISLR